MLVKVDIRTTAYTTRLPDLKERETVSSSKMDVILTVIYLMLAFALFKSLLSFPNRGKKLPPGPFKLPIIGNLAKLGELPHQSLTKLAQIYGPIMHLKLGHVDTIVISSPALAQQVLQKQDIAFSKRFIPDALCACDHFRYSVAFLPVGPTWINLRKIAHSNLFSVNKLDANQHLRSSKVNELIGYVKKCSQTGQAIDINRAAFRTSLNLLSNTIFSKDIADPSQDSAKEFRDLIWHMMVDIGKPNLGDFFPVLKKMDLQGIHRRMTSHFGNLIKIIDGLVTERMASKRSGSLVESNDVLDELIKISLGNPDQFDRTHMERLFLDIFVAGTDTTSSSVEWGMAELLKNSKTMVKAKAELNQVLGKGKILQEADIIRLPYLRCVVRETLRLHPPLPFLIPRQIAEEIEVNGYSIPKNSQVLVNAWAIGRDQTTWKNPLAFHPERFLDSDVDVKGQEFEMIPFGAGRRICPGLPLAMRTVPAMLGSLINCFDWELEGGIPVNELDMEEKFGITMGKRHPLCALATSVPVQF